MVFGLSKGQPHPLGASVAGQGVNFAVWAPRAERVDLCIFDADGLNETCLSLPGFEQGIWHGFLDGAKPGMQYGFRCHGSWAPAEGLRFNPAKLLVDPWARELAGAFNWHSSHLDHDEDTINQQDNSAHTFRSVVTEDYSPIPLGPRHDWADLVIYEAHVKGISYLNGAVNEQERGRFAGVAAKPVIEHLKALGINAIELLPVFAFVDERFLVERKLSNYWGYNPVNWFAPHPAYGTPAEFRATVQALHDAGIEVILDVVYNHSAESDETGPQVNLKGFDNAGYYTLTDDNGYANHTGCGNTLNAESPIVRQLVLDSLVYWHQVMGVDGFRFDLATTLGRDANGFEPEHSLLGELSRDPRLQNARLIAEPWDIGHGGYQAGSFPSPYAEWNDHFRDRVREFWLRKNTTLSALADVLTASRARFHHGARQPWSSVQFLCAHDGFSLMDLVSYREKHNLKNGEENRDGHNDNHSINCGVEGFSDDQLVNNQRQTRIRSMLSVLFVGQGTPMLQMGDECGHSRLGNNNAYCQDNEINWLNWDNMDLELFRFVQKLIDLRHRHAAMRLPHWIEVGDPAVCWLKPDGTVMDDAGWHNHDIRSMMVMLQSEQENNAVLVLINGSDSDQAFTLPHFDCILESDSSVGGCLPSVRLPAGSTQRVCANSVQIAVCDEEEYSASELDALGIQRCYGDATGRQRVAPLSTVKTVVAALTVGGDLLPEQSDAKGTHCYRPEWLDNSGRAGGIALQVYALRSSRNYGIGDFEDLRKFAVESASIGVDFLAINPLHARPLARPWERSPYAPTSRIAIDPVYIAPDKIAEKFNLEHVVDQAVLRQLQAGDWVDYPAVTDLKMRSLADLWVKFQGLASARHSEALNCYVNSESEWINEYIHFESEQLCAANPYWLSALEDTSLEDFLCWLQWIADHQLCDVQTACLKGGMKIGLYRDLAVGPVNDGQEAACGVFCAGIEVGAPPDAFSKTGQSWGVVPLNPRAPALGEFYRQLIAANMRHAGALRIDHVMGIRRLFFVPEGQSPETGLYVHYPDTLRTILAEISNALSCMVIGEDLGTLPEGFREQLKADGVFGLSIAMFEQHDADFISPKNYRRESVGSFGTHDLPPFGMWWTADDLIQRNELGLLNSDELEIQHQQRQWEKQMLLREMNVPDHLADDQDAVVESMHEWLKSSSSALVQFQLDDLTGEQKPINVPGTVDEYPNWARKYSVSMERLDWQSWNGLFQ